MPRKPSPPSPNPKKVLSLEEMHAGIARLSKRLDELNAFNVAMMREKYPPALTALEAEIKRSLEKTFGEGTSDFNRFAAAGRLSPTASIIAEPTPLYEYQAGVEKNIERSRALLDSAIRALKEDMAEANDSQQKSSPLQPEAKSAPSRRVFVVHGHDSGAKEAVARFIEKLGFEPVILHEQPNKGRTIITKFREEAADVGFAVVIMTPDDAGGKIGSEVKHRARQNVVFELGFFIGSLGPARVAALVKGNVERPSDFDGVVYISLDDGSWKVDLGKELQAAGLDVDWNKVMRA